MIPKACIRGGADHRAGMTFCGRGISDREFVFDDAPYAAGMYDLRIRPKTPIAVCETCADAVNKVYGQVATGVTP
jgi:hypothetical protein